LSRRVEQLVWQIVRAVQAPRHVDQVLRARGLKVEHIDDF
jgi:hypothetical protein